MSDRLVRGRNLAQLREKYGTRAERRRARFAELKLEEKKRRREAKPRVIMSLLNDWMNKKNWKKKREAE